MAYTKQTWADLPSKTTPINAERLTHIEDGIFNAAQTADTAASTAGTASANVGIVAGRVETLTGRVNDLDTAVSNKVDKVADKGLSTNDYDDTDKGKVDSLGTASTKNSTSVVTESSDLVESGAVYTALQGKADNSVIGTVEGANASKAWSVGEHFIKDGQFKEVTNPIASGEAINSGNTTDKQIADIVTIKKISVTPSTGITFNTANAIKIFGKLIMINIVIDSISLSSGSAIQIGYVETSVKPSKEIYTTGVSNIGVPLRVAINTSGLIFVYPQTAITSGKVGFSLIYEI